MTISVTGVGLIAPGVSTVEDLAASDVRVPADGVAVGGAPTDGDPVDDDPGWFDPVPHLGRRGWKYLTPATRYLLAAANIATGREPGDKRALNGRATRSGVCVGTHRAIEAVHASMDRTVREHGPAGLSPAELPGFSANMPASQLAIGMACRAFSVTLTNPVVGGLDAVFFAMSALRRGRADEVLAAATDEACAAAGTLGGAAVLRLVRGRHPEAGRLVHCVSRFVPYSTAGGWEPTALRAAAHRISALGERERRARFAYCGSAATTPVAEAVREAFAGAGVVIEDAAFVGADARFGTVSPLLQLAGLLGGPGPGLVVAVSDDGHLAALTVDGPGDA
ncbi:MULTISPECIES: beta-ketoacyl synthase N-terminal-like domain-containing protein [Streptomyces]|uniref:beta-ketoacyl synthase N-terminal-like domain-containing protein n=1 Tax=Streptomyces TaxID=1883 RepID=UPI00163CCF1F|nr:MULTISPECIES: beta-ketoacyl synthase N-terminal-like domain-containing protein [Streptomyces]MBC2875733.1 hypothetical protein [Streptomyces sp. TYQ1024]UBI37586.1 hypothetical protein K7I03_14670 [Streptomyces mobaraensis]UKW30174.1 hypothetical protein MCU78_14635 [Streptomyces sp. TYQ1024]